MKYRLISDYKYNPYDPNFFQKLIFKNRNVKLTREFLAPTKDNLNDWQLLDNIEEGIALLNKHLHNNIFLIVDSDVDGYTSAAIFYNFLQEKENNKLNIKWMVHEGKQHGIIPELVPDDTDLLVVIDAGSNQYGAHKELSEKGIDILVIDHHEAPKYSEYAVVINNQLSSNYPNKQLSGAGLAYQFCRVLAKETVDKYLDLAALGIIADMRDVRDLEHRYIIHYGLKNIKNPFFKALIEQQKYSLGSQSINSIGVMFYIAPLINALIRVGTMQEKELMFKAFIEGEKVIPSTKKGAKENETETIAQQAARICANAKPRQKKIVDALQEKIESMLTEDDLINKPIIFITLQEIENRNIVGLVANQLAHKYKKPALVLIADEQETYTGSGRNYNLGEIENFKDILNETKFFEFAEGHQSAFGAKIKTENINTFLNYCDESFTAIDSVDTYDVDLILDVKDMSSSIVQQIAKLRSLWGKEFEEPYIVVKNITVLPEDINIMGKNQNHIKFRKNNVDFVIFNFDTHDIINSKSPFVFDILGRCDINVWRDRVTYQIIAVDYDIKQSEHNFGF